MNREFIKKVKQEKFVRILCTSREVEGFAALYVVQNILEKELVKYEVVWSLPEESSNDALLFEILIGEGCSIKKGAVITDKRREASKDVTVLCGETIEEVLLNLCKETGHLTSDMLWCICISGYQHSGWRNRQTVCAEEEKENMHEEVLEYKAAIDQFGQQKEEKKLLEIQNTVYFPFGKWTTLYEALSLDTSVIADLGLFYHSRHAKHSALENSEYFLNQFLARLGIPISEAKSTSADHLIGATGKIIEKSFLKRPVYVRYYDYNMGVSHIEAFFAICALIRKRKYAEAVFAFKNISYLSIPMGLQEYRKAAHSIKTGFLQRKAAKIQGESTTLIPKGVLRFKSSNELTLMEEVFLSIRKLSEKKYPYRKVVMVAYVEDIGAYKEFISEV
ncbi:hypothetical protein NECID01_0150 [Nematocida sp. AWRm77]|nr:hypothetical protein NECID01_0150 [Nematocida sp. AWRm77]